MSQQIKFKDASPLVQAVLSLDYHFSELQRLSGLIGELNLQSDFEVNQARKMMSHFSEYGEAVGVGIADLAKQLNEARLRAEAAAQIVAAKADQLKAQQDEQTVHMEAFRLLTEKVQALGEELKDLKTLDGEGLTDENRIQMTARLTELDGKLQPLIEESLVLKKKAHELKLKSLEQNADSLYQTLKTVSRKIESVPKIELQARD